MDTRNMSDIEKQERIEQLTEKKEVYVAIYVISVLLLLLSLIFSSNGFYVAAVTTLVVIGTVYFVVKLSPIDEEVKSLKIDLGLIPDSTYQAPVPIEPTMTTCKVCHHPVSTTAPSCPVCGETYPGSRVSCPNCGSMSFMVGKRGFSPKNAIVGIAIAGLAGTLGGFVGSKDIEFLCVKCNHRWKPN